MTSGHLSESEDWVMSPAPMRGKMNRPHPGIRRVSSSPHSSDGGDLDYAAERRCPPCCLFEHGADHLLTFFVVECEQLTGFRIGDDGHSSR
jgi:hypothetical protein